MGEEKKIYRKRLIVGKSGELEVEPTFTKSGVYFHPLPLDMRDGFQEGDEIEGSYGFSHPTGKKDKRGVEIFTRYFIPVK